MQIIYRLFLSFLLALQLSLAGVAPSHAHVSGKGVVASGKASIKSVQSAIKSKIDNIAPNRGVKPAPVNGDKLVLSNSNPGTAQSRVNVAKVTDDNANDLFLVEP